MKSLHPILRSRMVFCERYKPNRYGLQSIRTLHHSNGYPLSFWVEAYHTTIYTLNCIGPRLIPSNTPFTLWYGSKPSLEHLQIFGCQAYAFIDNKHRNKLDPKSHLYFFLGYYNHTKGHQLWDPLTSRVLIRRNVIFNEQILYGTLAMVPSASSSPVILLANNETPSTILLLPKKSHMLVSTYLLQFLLLLKSMSQHLSLPHKLSLLIRTIKHRHLFGYNLLMSSMMFLLPLKLFHWLMCTSFTILQPFQCPSQPSS